VYKHLKQAGETSLTMASSFTNSNNVSEAEMYMRNFQNIIAEGKEPDMLKEYKPKFAVDMERPLSPQKLKNHVLKSEKVKDLISLYAQKTNKTPKEIEQQVKEIIDEIGLERNMLIIRTCGMAITAISKRICSGIYVNAENIQKVRSKMGTHQVLYLPSHRSYMDFILMSYICYYYEIEIPGIAAGMGKHLINKLNRLEL